MTRRYKKLYNFSDAKIDRELSKAFEEARLKFLKDLKELKKRFRHSHNIQDINTHFDLKHGIVFFLNQSKSYQDQINHNPGNPD